MDFDEADLLALAFESVEEESEVVVSAKQNPRSNINAESESCEAPQILSNCQENSSFLEDDEDDVLALAFKTIEESKKFLTGEKKKSSLVGVDLNFENNFQDDAIKGLVKESSKIKSEKSVVHSGDTDSSDDEDNKYFEESRYNTYGKTIKNALKDVDRSSGLVDKNQTSSWKGKPQMTTTSFLAPEKKVPPKQTNEASFDPVFGIRIVNPLVSSQTIKEKMAGRTPISFMKLKSHVVHGDLKSDWVIAAVVVRKFPPRVSQNGNNYSNWILSDLKGSLKTASLFLFGRAHQDLWKTPSGTVLAILNPSVLNDNKTTDFEAKLSIKSSDQIMIWGKSKDLGQCNFRKKNGEICGTFVNVSECEFCVYHVQQEYKKFNSRAELQTNGKTKVNLRNKVLGKNEVFYGGKSFTAMPVFGKKTQNPKDKERLKGLGMPKCQPEKPPEKVSIPLLQRSNKLFNMLPSGNSLLPSNLADEKRLNSLLKTEKKNTTVSEVKENTPVKKVNVLKTPTLSNKPSLTNPGNEISFDLELSSPKLHPSVNKVVKETSKGKPQRADKKKLQKRFSSLIGMTSDASPVAKQPLSGPAPCTKNIEKGQTNTSVASKVLQKQDPKTVNSNKSALPQRIGKDETMPVQKTENSKVPKNVLVSAEEMGSSPQISLETTAAVNSKEINPIVPVQRQKPNPKAPPNSGMSKAKLKALQFIKSKGPISKENPTGTEDSKKGIKRPLSPTSEEDNDKKPVLSERFLQLMNQKSIHEDLVEAREIEQEFEYFNKMEKKDRLEEKMLNTFKVECKAVRCLKCNYIWFSASDACKADGHPIKVVDAIKRFFKCGKCSNRTISLTLIPLIPCKKCFSSNWVRAPMIREKLVKNDTLSIRGGEQKFVNGSITNGSLDLLVPD